MGLARQTYNNPLLKTVIALILWLLKCCSNPIVYLKMFILVRNFMIKSVLRNIFKFLKTQILLW